MSLNINVTANTVSIISTQTINQGEYGIHNCNFTFTAEYDNLEKRAIFYTNISKKYLVEIIDNTCIIPEDVLDLTGTLYIGVYAYENEGDKLKLRYSPKRTSLNIDTGSYIKNTNTVIPPSASIDLMQKVNNLVNEIQTMLNSGEFDGADGVGISNIVFNQDYTMTIILTNGVSYTSQSLKGEKGNPGQKGADGQPGPTGNGIVSIEKTSTSGLVDTYIINYTNGTTSEFTVTNGGNYDDTEIKQDIADLEQNKANASDIPTDLKDLNDDSTHRTVTDSEKTTWDNKSDFSGSYNDLSNKPDLSGFITNAVDNLVYYYKKTETYTQIEINQLISAISTMNIQVVQTLPIQEISTTTIYLLPRQSQETGNIYDEYIYVSNNWEKIGSTDVDLSGYQTKIDNSHKLSADLVDDTNQTNKFVISTEKNTWNAKYDKPSGGIPKADLSSAVQTSLEKADTALQAETYTGTITSVKMNGSTVASSGEADLGTILTQHQDITGKEDISNKVTSLSSNSTDTQYPSAKCVYDLVGNIESLLSEV